VSHADERGAIAFAEKVLELLDEGRFVATYKFAVLLALLDLCLELTESSGVPPQMITTRQLADKVVEIYWPHTLPFVTQPVQSILRQNVTGQAEIVSLIRRFRERHAPDATVPRWESRRAAPDRYESLVRNVEWKLIEMPLPRLQTMGRSHRPFIYEIQWDHAIDRRAVAAYQEGGPSGFDNRIMLAPHVGEYLLQLSGLLRPLIQRRWAAMVAQLNRMEESQLEQFLFGADRTPTAKVRAGLWEIQERRCFYCDARLGDPAEAEVDHFLPWSRYPDDGLDNYVVADKRCNGWKSSSLAASEHLSQWADRFNDVSAGSGSLALLAAETGWERATHRILGVARAIYFRLPNDARLWLQGRDFVAPDADVIRRVLAIVRHERGR
jgi:5-methylcytosine-specific restriction endonuclease McrA